MDSENRKDGSHSHLVPQDAEGTGRFADGTEAQQSGLSPLEEASTHTPATHSPYSRRARTSTFSPSLANGVEGDESAFASGPTAPLCRVGRPEQQRTAGGERDEADGAEPPHAPDEESSPLFSPPPPLPRLQTPSSTQPNSTPSTKVTPITTSSGGAKKEGDGDTAPPPAAPQPPTLPPDETAPDFIEFFENPDSDGYGLRSLMEAVTNPQLLLRIQYSFRTVLLVTFPLYTIALHPNTRYRLGFPQMLIASVVSTSTHRPTLGEQIGLHSWTWRGIIFMLVWGTAADAWGVANHVGAWYGLLAAGIFGAGLVNNGMMRRFVYLYFFLYMLELRTHQHYFSYVAPSDAAWSACDYLIGSLMGVAANIFPFPSLVRDTVDVIMTKIFAGFGKLLLGMVSYTWSADVHAAAFFFNDRSPFVTIESVLSHMSALLWFTSWEPMEFPLRNPIRRVKLSLLRRMMALGYAAFSCGHTIAVLRQRRADKVAMHKIRCTLYQTAHSTSLKAIADTTAAPKKGHRSDPSRSGDDTSTTREQAAAQQSMDALHANTHTYVKDFATTLMQAIALIGSTESTPEQLLKKVPFDALREKDTVMRRNLRLEVLQVMKMQSEMVARRRAREQQAHTADKDDVEEKEEEADSGFDATGGSSSNNSGEDENFPYGARARYHHRKADAALLLTHHEIVDSFEVFLRINQIFFHLLMSMLAGEVLNFGEQMREYKPTESLLCRWWRHYIVEAWDGFWSELWCRVTMARPTDYRTVKDALRMTCAYLAATALNTELWNSENGLYFFGVTPLLGLPVEEESLGIGVCRIAGNTMGCALGYLTYHNTTNFAQQIAMVLCFAFLQQCCKYHAVYGQFFFYGSVITLAGLATSMVFNELVTRLVTSSYTVMAYMLCCMFIFPNDCRKICFNYRCKLTKVMSETIDDVALTARLALAYEEEDPDTTEPVAYPFRNTEQMQMCSQLNVQLTLMERLQEMCDKWAPFAAGELVIRGMAQFPASPNTLITLAHDRMAANLRLLVFGVQLLHRPRTEPPAPTITRFLHTSLADFLDDFADAVRLVGMDHVHALQRSRTWSYPRHLSRVSQMRRLRVRVHALMYECYVLVANHMSKGTFGMTARDFEVMRCEAAAEAKEKKAAVAHHVHNVPEDLSFLPGAGGNPVEGAVPLSQPAPGSMGKKKNELGVLPAAREPIEVDAGEEAAVANMSFVDRYLVARQEEERSEEAATARSRLSRCSSRLANASGEAPNAGEVGPAGLVLPSPSPAFSSFASQHRNESIAHPDNAEEGSLATTSFTSRRRTAPYAHRAHLHESTAEPRDAWPLTVDSAERDVAQLLTAKQKKEPAAQQSTPSGVDRKTAEETEMKSSFAPVAPTKVNRHVSQLILLPDKGPETYIPLYDGPRFTYMEDELDVPADTDFSAITTILLSCESIMAEYEALPGSLNTLTNYDKQLQESSMATAFLDKWSAKLVAYRKGIHDRYHYPTPLPQKRRPLHAQENPFEDWKF